MLLVAVEEVAAIKTLKFLSSRALFLNLFHFRLHTRSLARLLLHIQATTEHGKDAN